MAYTQFADNKPVATDTGPDVVDDMRNNLMAIRDMVVMGAMPGWTMTPSGGTASQPTTITWSKGTERIKAVLTWGTTGGADGNVTVAVYSYSSDSGGTYDTIGTETMTYDVDGNITKIEWS